MERHQLQAEWDELFQEVEQIRKAYHSLERQKYQLQQEIKAGFITEKELKAIAQDLAFQEYDLSKQEEAIIERQAELDLLFHSLKQREDLGVFEDISLHEDKRPLSTKTNTPIPQFMHSTPLSSNRVRNIVKELSAPTPEPPINRIKEKEKEKEEEEMITYVMSSDEEDDENELTLADELEAVNGILQQDLGEKTQMPFSSEYYSKLPPYNPDDPRTSPSYQPGAGIFDTPPRSFDTPPPSPPPLPPPSPPLPPPRSHDFAIPAVDFEENIPQISHFSGVDYEMDDLNELRELNELRGGASDMSYWVPDPKDPHAFVLKSPIQQANNVPISQRPVLDLPQTDVEMMHSNGWEHRNDWTREEKAVAGTLAAAGLYAAYWAYKSGLKDKIKRLFQKKPSADAPPRPPMAAPAAPAGGGGGSGPPGGGGGGGAPTAAAAARAPTPTGGKDDDEKVNIDYLYQTNPSKPLGPHAVINAIAIQEEEKARQQGEDSVVKGSIDDLKIHPDRNKGGDNDRVSMKLPPHLGEEDLTLVASFDSRKGRKSSLWESKRNKDGNVSIRSKYWKHRSKDQTWGRVSRSKRIQYMSRGRRGFKPRMKKYWGRKMSEINMSKKAATSMATNQQNAKRLRELIAQKSHYRKDVVMGNIGQALLTSRKH